jgi:hypothetical protein
VRAGPQKNRGLYYQQNKKRPKKRAMMSASERAYAHYRSADRYKRKLNTGKHLAHLRRADAYARITAFGLDAGEVSTNNIMVLRPAQVPPPKADHSDSEEVTHTGWNVASEVEAMAVNTLLNSEYRGQFGQLATARTELGKKEVARSAHAFRDPGGAMYVTTADEAAALSILKEVNATGSNGSPSPRERVDANHDLRLVEDWRAGMLLVMDHAPPTWVGWITGAVSETKWREPTPFEKFAYFDFVANPNRESQGYYVSSALHEERQKKGKVRAFKTASVVPGDFCDGTNMERTLGRHKGGTVSITNPALLYDDPKNKGVYFMPFCRIDHASDTGTMTKPQALVVLGSVQSEPGKPEVTGMVLAETKFAKAAGRENPSRLPKLAASVILPGHVIKTDFGAGRIGKTCDLCGLSNEPLSLYPGHMCRCSPNTGWLHRACYEDGRSVPCSECQLMCRHAAA